MTSCFHKYRVTNCIRLEKQIIYIQSCMKCFDTNNFIINTEKIKTSPAERFVNRLNEIVAKGDKLGDLGE